jgi:transcriptional regulator with XRE-family HTH domain
MQNNILNENIAYNDGMAGRPALTQATESGARLAKLRTNAGLTQIQLAEATGIPPRAITFYERKAHSIPSHLVLKISEALNIAPETLLGAKAKKTKNKRGPKSEIEKRLELIQTLPKPAQKRILSVVDAILAQEKQAR